jgi:hypothetical protein
MPKSIVLAVLALSLSSLAQASTDPIGIRGDEVVDCTITQIDEHVISFFPPKVGSKVRFDLAATEISDRISFEDGTMIALVDPSVLKRTPPTVSWRNHQMFFSGSSPSGSRAVQVIVGAYGTVSDPLERRNWSALIQILSAGVGNEWNLSQISLSCNEMLR